MNRDSEGKFQPGHTTNRGKRWRVVDTSAMGGRRFSGETSYQWKGGKPKCLDDIGNIQPLCKSCNSRKYNKIIRYACV